jgi:hypothetical protein
MKQVEQGARLSGLQIQSLADLYIDLYKKFISIKGLSARDASNLLWVMAYYLMKPGRKVSE